MRNLILIINSKVKNSPKFIKVIINNVYIYTIIQYLSEFFLISNAYNLT